MLPVLVSEHLDAGVGLLVDDEARSRWCRRSSAARRWCPRRSGSSRRCCGAPASRAARSCRCDSWTRILVGAVAAARRAACCAGEAVPMPTLPSALMSMLLVGAPGRMRKGRREPPVTSRTKKFASLPATSQVWAVKPPRVVLLQPDRRRVAGVDVEVEHRGRGAQAEPAGAVDEDRVGRRAGGDRERHRGSR